MTPVLLLLPCFVVVAREIVITIKCECADIKIAPDSRHRVAHMSHVRGLLSVRLIETSNHVNTLIAINIKMHRCFTSSHNTRPSISTSTFTGRCGRVSD